MNDDIKKYQVISSGEVLKGFSILDVSKALARLYKIEPSNAIETLISGTNRKVRSARSKAHADSICAKLQALGLRCFVSEVRPEMSDDLSMHTQMLEPTDYDDYEDDVEPLSESADEALASIDEIYKDATDKVAKNKFIKRAGLIIIILSVIGIGSWVLISQWLKTKPLTLVNQIELAMESIMPSGALVFADLNRTRKLSSFSSLLGSKKSLDSSNFKYIDSLVLPFNILSADSIFNQSDFLAARVYTPENSKLKRSDGDQWLMALTGQFDFEQIKFELAKEYKPIIVSDDLIRLTPLAGDSNSSQCQALDSKKESSLYVAFKDDFVVFSSSKDLNHQFQSKLTGLKLKGEASSTSINSWHNFRNESLLSVKIANQYLLESNSVIQSFFESNFASTQLNELSIKLTPDLINRDMSLQIAFMSEDVTALSKPEQALKNNIEHVQTQAPSNFDNVNKFLSQLEINNTDELTINAKLQSELLADIDGVIIDIVDIVNNEAISSAANELDFIALDQVWDYQRNDSFLENRKLRSSNSSVYQRQGISIFLDSVGVSSNDPGATKRMQLSALKSVPSVSSKKAWNQSGIEQKLIIKDVLDKKGMSIMKNNGCNSDIQTSLNKGLLKSVKSVELNSGISIEILHQVQGIYKLLSPTSVKKIDISMADNRQAKWEDGHLRLSEINGSRMQYRIFGSPQSLLDIRAKNINGEYLKEKETKVRKEITTKFFHGAIDSVELYVANEWQDLSFDFTVNSPLQKAVIKSERSQNNRVIKAFTGAERKAFSKKITGEELVKVIGTSPSELGRVTTKSANLIFKNALNSDQINTLFGEVVVPYNELLLQDSNAVSVYLEINKKYKVEFSPQFLLTNSPKEIVQLGADRLLRGHFTIKLDSSIDEIENLKGKLMFKMPSRVNRTVASVGDNSKSQLQVLSYDFGVDQSTTYAASKDYYSAILTTENDNTFIANKLKENVFKFGTADTVKKIELLSVSRYDKFSEKFNLSIKK